MKLILTPQRADFDLRYEANGDVLTVSVDGESDTFDFSILSDGDRAIGFVTTLPANPMLSAEKTGEDIVVTAISYYSAQAEDDEKIAREVII